MLITDTYKDLNRKLHETNPNYGMSGQKYAQMVMQLATALRVPRILDYGCGKCSLANSLPQFQVTNYDPCIPGFDASPDPHDLVVCTDVLEHIEPECLDDVLKDLNRVTNKILFLQVATRPAVKTLEDGRNTHLIVEKPMWWLDKLGRYGFRLDNFMNQEDKEFMATYTKVGGA